MKNQVVSASVIALSAACMLLYLLAHHARSIQLRVHADGFNRPFRELSANLRIACPETAFVTDQGQADYQVQALWYAGKWNVVVTRSDSAAVYDAQGPDYVQILREACGRIDADAEKWSSRDAVAQARLPRPSREGDAEYRYELRDVHNGSTSTSAIFDRRTGRVWIWTNLTGKSGKSESAFVAEDVYSYTDSPIPDPTAGTR
jgi:hypothetical protein